MIVSHGVEHLAGRLSDAELVDASIELLFNPFSPFDIDVSDAHAREALTHLYSGIRRVDVAAIDDEDTRTKGIEVGRFVAARILKENGFPDVAKVYMMGSHHQQMEAFEIIFNKQKHDSLPAELRAILRNAAFAASR